LLKEVDKMRLFKRILRNTIPQVDYSVNIQGFKIILKSFVHLGLFRNKKWATSPLLEKGVRLGIDNY